MAAVTCSQELSVTRCWNFCRVTIVRNLRFVRFASILSGLDKIEFLQSHENQEIYQKAFDLIEHYFGVEEEDASLAPQVDQNQGQFVFQQQEGPMEGFQL